MLFYYLFNYFIHILQQKIERFRADSEQTYAEKKTIFQHKG